MLTILVLLILVVVAAVGNYVLARHLNNRVGSSVGER